MTSHISCTAKLASNSLAYLPIPTTCGCTSCRAILPQDLREGKGILIYSATKQNHPEHPLHDNIPFDLAKKYARVEIFPPNCPHPILTEESRNTIQHQRLVLKNLSSIKTDKFKIAVMMLN